LGSRKQTPFQKAGPFKSGTFGPSFLLRCCLQIKIPKILLVFSFLLLWTGPLRERGGVHVYGKAQKSSHILSLLLAPFYRTFQSCGETTQLRPERNYLSIGRAADLSFFGYWRDRGEGVGGMRLVFFSLFPQGTQFPFFAPFPAMVDGVGD